MTSPRHKPHGWEIQQLLILGGVGLLFGVTTLMWLTGRVAGSLFGHGVPRLAFTDTSRVLVGLGKHPTDPRLAWPDRSDQSMLPGAAGFYSALLLTLVVVGLLVIVPIVIAILIRRDSRTGPTDPPRHLRKTAGPRLVPRPRPGAPSTAFATARDLDDLAVPGPQPGRVSLGWSYGRLIAAEVEHSVLVVGATRSGKTRGFAIPTLREWAGPAVVLSAKTDLIHATFHDRRQTGDVWVFDPIGVSRLPGTGWSPLGEAVTWAGAVRIASAMSRLSGTTDGLGGTNHWERVAAQLLAPLLHAAALGGDDMGRLLTWVKTQRVGAAMAALSRAGEEVAAESLQSTLDTEPRQRDSAFNTVRTVLDAYEDPGVLEASRTCTVDAWPLVESTGTLYLVATASDQARLAPLFLGLLDQITRAAYQRAARARANDGRVVHTDQERLLLLLDEAANIAPIPDLAALASTAGGEGIQLLTIFQDLSQLRHRYGSEWGSIASNHVCKIALPGISDPETLRYFAQATGDEEILETSTSHSEGRRSTTETLRRRPILAERDLRELHPGEAAALYGHRPPMRLGVRRTE